MVKKVDSGFIVHPFETGRGYGASYRNHNKTVKYFKTLKQAKSYLKRKKIKTALYDSPSGNKRINLTKKTKPIKRRIRRSQGQGFNFLGNLKL